MYYFGNRNIASLANIYISFLVGPPSAPVINQTVERPTSIYLTWTMPQNEIIDYFWLNYSYSVK